jgi:predicted DNA binding CopG/RHH family protein
MYQVKAQAKKPRGRPTLPEGAAKVARVDLRAQPADKAAWQAKATAAGLTLQAWIERALGRAR